MSEGFVVYKSGSSGPNVGPDGLVRAYTTQGELTTSSPRSAVRANCYCKVYKLPLISGLSTRIQIPSCQFDDYAYLRRPNGVQFWEADSAGDYTFTPDITGDWEWEVTTYGQNNVGYYTVVYNREPTASEVQQVGVGTYPYRLEGNYLCSVAAGNAWSAWFKFTANGSATIEMIGEDFDDWIILTDNSRTILNQQDSGIITQTLTNGTYYAICRAYGGNRVGTGYFRLSGAGVTS